MASSERCDGLVGFSRNAFCLNWEGISQLGCNRIHWSCLNSAGLWPGEFACLKLPGEAGAAGLGTTLQDLLWSGVPGNP